MTELPKGWAETSLLNIVVHSLGGDWGKDCSEELIGYERIKVVRGTEFKNWRIHRASTAAERYIKRSSLELRRLEKGDIVVEVSGGGPTQPVGRTILIDEAALNSSSLPLVCSNFFRQVRLHESINSVYVSLFLSYAYSQSEFDEFQTQTTNLRNLNFTRFLNNVNIPVPPINEQRRIVPKLEQLLSRVEVVRARLAKIPRILKRFRQSVLAAACSGRLTADWRKENRNAESAAELLKRIRGMRLETASNNKEITQIQTAFSNSFHNNDERLELPPTWAFCSIGVIGTVSNGSTPSRKVSGYWGGNIHWVSSGEVRNNIISTTREFITKRGFDNSSVRLLPCGTVLLAMIGEGKTRGQTAILDIEATINQNIAAIDLRHGLLAPAYLWRWFQYQYEMTREQGSGSGPQALNCQRVRELPLFLPPLTEQQEIVRRVEALFKTADALEARYRTAKTHIDKLTQSILARAFRGKLVPQDPNDEPASALLARIQRERSVGVKKKVRRRIS